MKELRIGKKENEESAALSSDELLVVVGGRSSREGCLSLVNNSTEIKCKEKRGETKHLDQLFYATLSSNFPQKLGTSVRDFHSLFLNKNKIPRHLNLQGICLKVDERM